MLTIPLICVCVCSEITWEHQLHPTTNIYVYPLHGTYTPTHPFNALWQCDAMVFRKEGGKNDDLETIISFSNIAYARRDRQCSVAYEANNQIGGNKLIWSWKSPCIYLRWRNYKRSTVAMLKLYILQSTQTHTLAHIYSIIYIFADVKHLRLDLKIFLIFVRY